MNDLNLKFSKITPSKLIEVYNEKGYPVSSKVGYPNLFGVRANTCIPNKFDDIVGYFLLRSDGGYEMSTFDATTDPGTYWLRNPMNVKGTAIMCPGSYLAYKIGLHKGQYTAYVQRGEIKVWRDNNKNNVLDFNGRTDEGYFGVNIHRANASMKSKQVDKWSAGCQVIADYLDFNKIIKVGRAACEKYGKESMFRYSLFEEKDFKRFF